MAHFNKTSRSGLSVALLALAVGTSTALAGCATEAVVEAQPAQSSLSSAEGYTGRIRLTRFLDEPDGYCLDVPGPPSNVMLQFPLVAHTCHADPWADQVFQFNLAGQGLIRWTMDDYDLCFTADAAEPMSALNLRDCEAGDRQAFTYTTAGELRLSSTDLCIHVERTGPGFREPVGEDQDARGRGRSVNPQFTHLMRRLEMRACGEGDPAMSRWTAIQ